MKTTVDIPEGLYKRVKILAVERGVTLKQLVLTSLERALEEGGGGGAGCRQVSFSERRRPLPEFLQEQRRGALKPGEGDAGVTDWISEDRDAR